MGYVNTVSVVPVIPCKPGWCLQYVREAAGLPAVHPTATAAWEASTTKHRDRDFPPGVWVPVWFGLDREPAGHVVWLAPDGAVWSTSDNDTTPHRHPDMDDLEAFYAGWGWPLTYRGWTEDVQGTPVMSWDGIAAQGTTEEKEDELTPDQMYELKRFIQKDAEERHTVTRNFITQEVARKVESSEYDVKLWTQEQDNKTGDRVIDRLEGKL